MLAKSGSEARLIENMRAADLAKATAGWDGDVLLVEPVGGRNDSALADLPGYMESSVEQLTSVKQPLLSPPPPRLQAD